MAANHIREYIVTRTYLRIIRSDYQCNFSGKWLFLNEFFEKQPHGYGL